LKNLITDYYQKLNLSFPDMSDILKAFVMIFDAWSLYKNIYVCGNGGSASISNHFSCDLTKLGIPVYSLDTDPATITMFTNDDGWDKVYVNQLNNRFWKDDVLICLSVHGGVGTDKAGKWSQNLLRAIEYVKSQNGKIIGIVGDTGGEILKLADTSILIKSTETPIIESHMSAVTHLLSCLLKDTRPSKMCGCGKIRNSEEAYCQCGQSGFRYQKGIVGNIEEWKKLI